LDVGWDWLWVGFQASLHPAHETAWQSIDRARSSTTTDGANTLQSSRTQADGLQQDLTLVHAPDVGQELHGDRDGQPTAAWSETF
jgi:hypothetical protein